MDVFRVFDSLNWTENMRVAMAWLLKPVATRILIKALKEEVGRA